ncbi:MAG: hypothetical protein ACR2H6_00180 [Pyrinomonadaceae bacterium]
MKNKLFVMLFVFAGLGLTAWTAYAQQKANSGVQVWEYQEIHLSATQSSKPKFDQLGAQGWELVSVIVACPANPNATASCDYWAYMKRPR